jgi:hypothetical protein
MFKPRKTVGQMVPLPGTEPPVSASRREVKIWGGPVMIGGDVEAEQRLADELARECREVSANAIQRAIASCSWCGTGR